MSVESDLENLVFGAQRPDLNLVTTGRIAPSWGTDYERAVDEALKLSRGETWSRKLVQASHWVSFYLPLRLKVAASTVTIADETRRQVFHLHIWTERKLLASMASFTNDDIFASLRADHAQNSPEQEMIRLSLGRGNPALSISESASIRKWIENFEACWRPFASSLRDTENWNKWPTMAARIASFYWDVLFRQNFALSDSVETDIPSLKTLIPSTTLALIQAVLNPPTSEIDNTGLPIIGTPNQLGELSVRRLIEPTLTGNNRIIDPNTVGHVFKIKKNEG